MTQMKVFQVNNQDWEHWHEAIFHNAIDVVRWIRRNDFKSYEIAWKSPVTNQFVTLLIVEEGFREYENDLLRLPKIFNNVKGVKNQ